jgi:lipoprotein-anchoring transpeptidase ErfK/SrfK
MRAAARIASVLLLTVAGLTVFGAGAAQGPPDVAPSRAATTAPRAARVVFTVPKPSFPGPAYLVARVTKAIRTSAGMVRPTTPLGNETWLPIVKRSGRIGTALVATPTGQRRVKVDLSRLELRWTAARVEIDLSKLRLSVLRGGRLVGSFRVAAGAPGTPTPSGRFFVTDRVVFPASSPYGTFALGLSANQKNPTPGWSGGDQVAIHGTNHPESIGTYASLGCVRVPEAALKVLYRAMPLGAPVIIHA